MQCRTSVILWKWPEIFLGNFAIKITQPYYISFKAYRALHEALFYYRILGNHSYRIGKHPGICETPTFCDDLSNQIYVIPKNQTFLKICWELLPKCWYITQKIWIFPQIPVFSGFSINSYLKYITIYDFLKSLVTYKRCAAQDVMVFGPSPWPI